MYLNAAQVSNYFILDYADILYPSVVYACFFGFFFCLEKNYMVAS